MIQRRCSNPASPLLLLFATLAAAEAGGAGPRAGKCSDSACGSDAAEAGGEESALLQAPQLRRDASAIEPSNVTASSAISSVQLRCRWLAVRAPAEMKDPLESICSGRVVYLRNRDFLNGSLTITKPGIYVLAEDIVFAPRTPKLAPPKDSETYPTSKGFSLGFFAAIIIVADDVMLDLNGKSITCSYEFLLRQRFFQTIELANLPFNPGTGPPQFAQLFEPVVPANNVIITNGDIGLSSHISIHGNNNRNVWVDRVRMFDFEVAGFQVNNGSNIHLTRCSIGPTLGAPGSSVKTPALATLNQAINLLRLVEGAPWERKPVFRKLNWAVETFIFQRLRGLKVYPVEPFADPKFGYEGLPDGSALYGVIVTPAGPAVGEFNDCDGGLTNEILNLKDVKVKSLYSKVDEVVQLRDENGTVVAGPAGDVFQVFRVQDEVGGKYKGNVLSNAQAALGQLALDNAELIESNFERYFELFGRVYVPEAVQAWVRGEITFHEAVQRLGGSLVCGQDAQAHINKGTVGIRIECVDRVGLKRVLVRDMRQKGDRSRFASQCDAGPSDSGGDDARGLRVSGGPSWYRGRAPEKVKIKGVRSVNGEAIAVEYVLPAGSTVSSAAFGDASASRVTSSDGLAGIPFRYLSSSPNPSRRRRPGFPINLD